jgi:D-psicose/D-tagatose/L-ribulose 3-epimerase
MNLLLWTGFVTEELYPTLAKIKAAGFDGVEIPVFEGDPSHYRNLKSELDKQGLKCTTVTIVTPESNPISPDVSVRQAAVERLKWAVECNHALGAETMVGPFHSALGVFSGDPPTSDEKKRAVEVLGRCAEFAKQANLMLGIEYLNRFECYFLTTASDAAWLVRQVNHPNFRTMYDTFHANIEEVRPSTAIKTVAPYLAHVHISENNRGTPGTGQVNWFESFRSLRAEGYDGWLVIEAFGRALPSLAAATRVWRDFFPSPDHVYTHGIKFMKTMWDLAGAENLGEQRRL